MPLPSIVVQAANIEPSATVANKRIRIRTSPEFRSASGFA
jgi:hypothetical protein